MFKKSTVERTSRQLMFSDDEFMRRWLGLKRILQMKGDAFGLIVDGDTIFYLTGFSGTPTTFQAILIPTDGEPLHLMRYAERSSFDRTSWLTSARYYDDDQDPVEVLAEIIAGYSSSPQVIAVEKRSLQLSVARFDQLDTRLPSCSWTDISEEIGAFRRIRSNEEIEMHRRACVAIESGLQAGIDACAAGVTERDLGATIAAALVRAGCDTPRIGVISAGDNLQEVHGGLSDRPLAEGDMVRLEMSNFVNRYWARIMRMVSIGEPAPATRQRFELACQLQDEQIARMKPGAIPAELDALVRDRLPADAWTMQLTGYSLAFHEPAVIGHDLDRFTIGSHEHRPLEAGMVLHIYLNLDDVSTSETIAITDYGADRLTSFPRKIFVK